MKRVLAVLTMMLLLAGVEPASGHTEGASLISPKMVLGGPAITLFPTSNGSYLVWETDTRVHPRHWDVMARNLHTGHVRKLNPPGTQAFYPSIEPGSNTVDYQLVRDKRSLIIKQNLNSGARTPLTGKINSRSAQWGPVASDRFVLYLRQSRGGNWQLVRFDRVHQINGILDSEPARCRCLFAESVGNEWAAWTECPGHICRARIQSIHSATYIRVPNPTAAYEYAPVVNEITQDAYFVRSGASCGAHVAFMKWHIGSPQPAVVIATLPAGFDIDGRMSVAPNALGGRDLLFTRYNCRTRGADLFKLPNVAPPT